MCPSAVKSHAEQVACVVHGELQIHFKPKKTPDSDHLRHLLCAKSVGIVPSFRVETFPLSGSNIDSVITRANPLDVDDNLCARHRRAWSDGLVLTVVLQACWSDSEEDDKQRGREKVVMVMRKFFK